MKLSSENTARTNRTEDVICTYKVRETQVTATEYVVIDFKIHRASDVRGGCGL
jgi:hypothetical protein